MLPLLAELTASIRRGGGVGGGGGRGRRGGGNQGVVGMLSLLIIICLMSVCVCVCVSVSVCHSVLFQSRTFGCMCKGRLCGLTLDFTSGFCLYDSESKVLVFLCACLPLRFHGCICLFAGQLVLCSDFCCVLSVFFSSIHCLLCFL